MKYSTSVESDREAYGSYLKCRRILETAIENALATDPVLAAIDVKVRYIPIIMPIKTNAFAAARYPARTKNRKKERIFDCAPQLDYDVFVEGDFPRCVAEYLDGLAREAPKMKGLGLSKAEIQAFIDVLKEVEKQALANPPLEDHPRCGSMGGKK